ncbi:MAG: hypothetical protein ACK456_09775 [Pseudanabaenaceae cyanobacterium]
MSQIHTLEIVAHLSHIFDVPYVDLVISNNFGQIILGQSCKRINGQDVRPTWIDTL